MESIVLQSKLYKAYLKKFPTSHIARDVKQYGQRGMLAHGHFGTALREGRYDDAMYRADSGNLVKLHELGITQYLSKEALVEFRSRIRWAKGYVKDRENDKL